MSPQTPGIKSSLGRDCHSSVIYAIARHAFWVRAECGQTSIGFDDELL